MSSADFGPSFPLCRLFRKTSKRTEQDYWVGRLGMAKVVLLKSRETADDGGEIWHLMVQQAEEKPRQHDGKPSQVERAKANEPLAAARPSRPAPNDPLPF
ncbi:hypothetical protein [Hyphomicrobium sp. CS1BSMeth3]|uniref:hypothetical protein n=1 Tax=Hyphomicrobium sp. CS1BSMeth3 TaxID=1892844 RepID=UPI0009302116|nr:hypothetical protein [Hyphomicrobium sp. CS1BSMeth3]